MKDARLFRHANEINLQASAHSLDCVFLPRPRRLIDALATYLNPRKVFGRKSAPQGSIGDCSRAAKPHPFHLKACLFHEGLLPYRIDMVETTRKCCMHDCNRAARTLQRKQCRKTLYDKFIIHEQTWTQPNTEQNWNEHQTKNDGQLRKSCIHLMKN